MSANLSIINWNSHKSEYLQILKDKLDAKFEYIGNSLDSRILKYH
jgi:hypothetical protein